jgi:chromosome segregation protein
MARTVSSARQHLLDQERLRGGSELAHARASDETAAIRRQIAQELDLDDPDVSIESMLSTTGVEPEDGLDDADREREINRLRERLRRVGFVGQDVVADYEQEAQHQEFLRQQLDDVQGAAASLRGLLAELQTAMRSRFDATFAQVSAVFSEVFAVLFGGGTAQLILTGGEPNEHGVRSEPGVDIVAQPPGKRLQSLALLSGGERALTAVALLFAILRVNPAPFCLLDEVDAALDEANVVRFRDQLGTLAEKTQVIIVTHNRGTIETANTLYGVSMGADGVSRVLSMRMADEA